MNKNKLWTKNFTTIILATAMGAIGNIAGSFALSFLVFEETGSTLASALTVAIRLIPGFFIPLFVSPLMDRLPRKPFLVACDAIAAAVYLAAGLVLLKYDFNYTGYLVFSLIIASLGSFDELSYNALYPRLIPDGAEEKGYTVSSMLYPLLMVVMMPLSALLYRSVGTGRILVFQSVFCLLASVIENRIDITEEIREGTDFSFSQWLSDIKESATYLKKEKGLLAMTVYSSTTNGMSEGYSPLLVAFFSTMPGFTVAMYSFFTVVEFIGRTVGGTLIYAKEKPPEKKYGYALFVYLFYDIMDGCLLWLPYPLMLVNRTVCGFLGIQSGTMRYAATQKYIPDSMRARINAFQSVVYLIFSAVLTLLVGWMGDIMDLRLVLSLTSAAVIAVCLLTIVRNRHDVEKIYMYRPEHSENGQETSPDIAAE